MAARIRRIIFSITERLSSTGRRSRTGVGPPARASGPPGATWAPAGRLGGAGQVVNLDGMDEVMPWARTAPVPAMWSSATSRLLLAIELPATMLSIAVSRVET
jgi:hypothetical protein